MDKNTVIGMLLIVLVLVGFSYFNTPTQEQIAAQQQPEQVEKQKAESSQPTPAASIAAASPDTTGLFAPAISAKGEVVTLENEKIKVNVNTKGGAVESVWLKEFKSYDDYNAGRNEALCLYNSADASTDIVLETKHQNLRLADYAFSVVAKSDSTLTLQLKDESGREIAVDYALVPNNYLLNMFVRVVGMQNDFGAKTKSLAITWKDRVRQQEKGFYFENMYSTLTYKLSGDDTEKLKEQGNDETSVTGGVDWIAFKNQYFSSLLMAAGSADHANTGFENVSLKSQQEEEGSGFLKSYTAEADVAFDPAGRQATGFQYYFGPNNYRLLQSMDEHRLAQADQDLEELVYLGWPIVRWINRYFTIYVFDWLTQMGLPMGVVLLLITILLRIIVYVPSKKSYLSSAKMRVLKPKVDEIAKKYPKTEDAMKRQQETMALYSQYGVSPMGGCLPMLVQMPIWIAMFNFVPNAIELRQERFLWAEDLSTYDSLLSWPAELPLIGNHLSLFCLLFCVTNVIYSVLMMRQQRDTMSGEQAQQMKIMQWMMFLMPVFFFFMFNKYSSGLNYYYFISLLAGALVMWYLRKSTDDAKLLAKLEANYEANKHNPAKRQSGLAARLAALQEQQEELRKRQQQQRNPKNK